MKRSAADERFSSGNEPKIARVSSLQYLAKRALPESAEVPEAVQYSAGVAAMGRPDPIDVSYRGPTNVPARDRIPPFYVSFEPFGGVETSVHRYPKKEKIHNNLFHAITRSPPDPVLDQMLIQQGLPPSASEELPFMTAWQAQRYRHELVPDLAAWPHEM